MAIRRHCTTRSPGAAGVKSSTRSNATRLTNSAGVLAREALEGLQLLRLSKFASLMERAASFFPDGDVPRERDERQELLTADGVSERLEEADLDSKWYASYAGEEEISTAVLAYVNAHPEEFFIDGGGWGSLGSL